VEEGFEAVLSRKPRAMPAIARIFDGEKEAKLRMLPKKGACWKRFDFKAPKESSKF
jgi:hypothetical protein